ncbi:hypothetical protein MM239_12760 [Belliella sp. DSM 111904]|uniref:Uncharacterized protein n=1 Tax=Belliella filtrata TaxID=2923435 RepID=A0ABS9V1L1_9BACT|nr:hypothetical protein [Belliella filtrata]MCH7410271.1 hypothetical protein [Belliella filtrata]
MPDWSANDIRSTATCVFQTNGEGRNGFRALAVQPIVPFNGELYLKINPENFVEPKIAFFGKSKQKGSGNRPATVFVSYNNDGVTFSIPIAIGNSASFPNSDTAYKLYEIAYPRSFPKRNC